MLHQALPLAGILFHPKGPRDADLPTGWVCGGMLSAERPWGRAVHPGFRDEASQLCGGQVTEEPTPDPLLRPRRDVLPERQAPSRAGAAGVGSGVPTGEKSGRVLGLVSESASGVSPLGRGAQAA